MYAISSRKVTVHASSRKVTVEYKNPPKFRLPLLTKNTSITLGRSVSVEVFAGSRHYCEQTGPQRALPDSCELASFSFIVLCVPSQFDCPQLACSKGFYEICLILDSEGVNLHAVDDDGWGCLHYSVNILVVCDIKVCSDGLVNPGFAWIPTSYRMVD
jgi:hypothetical protein